MTVTLRPAALNDAATLAELTTQLGYPVAADEQERRLRGVMGRPDDAVLVAVDERDRPIGWIHVALAGLLELSDTALIQGLVVDEAYRSAGVGRLLTEAGEAWARDHGAARMQVRSRISRERAHRFYAREGYDRIKTSYVFEKRL